MRVIAQHMGDDTQDTMRDRHHRFLFAVLARQPVKLGREIIATGVGEGPRNLAQDRPLGNAAT